MPSESEEIEQQLTKLGRMVESAIMRSITSLAKQDKHLAMAVVKEDEQIDCMEVEIEERCIAFLESQRPVGAELRFVLAALKINDALERIADQAENVAKTVAKIDNWGSLDQVNGCHQMAKRSQAMVKKCLESLLRRDTKLAKQVISDDESVDEMRTKMERDIVHAIDNSADSSQDFLRLEYIMRQLERMADLATNIAEDVIYLIDGQIVRHPSRFDDRDVLHDSSGGRFRRAN